jgi:hypothetical protein
MDCAKLDLVDLARDYAGKWVAIDPETRGVLAAGDSATEVYDAAGNAGVECPLILEVLDNYGNLAPWLE